MKRSWSDSIRAAADRYVFQLDQLRNSSPRRDVSCSLARTVHAHMTVSGFVPRGSIRNRLMDIYCRWWRVGYARRMFDEIPYPDVVAASTLMSAYSCTGNIKLAVDMFNRTPMFVRDTAFYNAMITAYSRNYRGLAALIMFRVMRRDGFQVDDLTFTCVLGALASVAYDEKDIQQLHCAVVTFGSLCVTAVANALLSAYLKCARSPSALTSSVMTASRKLFDEIFEKDELTWTTMIVGYIKNDDLGRAREIFMISDKKKPAWNSLISGYVHRGLFKEALSIFREMLASGIQFDEYTFTSIISACSNGGFLEFGRQLHANMLRTTTATSLESSLPTNNALVTLYWKCRRVNMARAIFDQMKEKDHITWNAILSGYVNDGRIMEAKSFFDEIPTKNYLSWSVIISGLAQNGYGEEALKLFNQMKVTGVGPCDFSFAGAIISCAVLGSLENGRQVHGQLIRFGFDASLSACNALITMYARCGAVDSAQYLFEYMPFLDSVSWNAVIAALAHHGRGAEALLYFKEMLMEGIIPDRISFLTILSACSYSGFIDEGWHYFHLMRQSYNIEPGDDHYARVVDLLCRAGKFCEARNLIESMPFKPGAPVWEAALAGSRIHGNMDLGLEAAERLFELMPQHDGNYIVLANMFAVAGRWNDMARVRKLMRERGVKKEPGCSWLEVEGKVHVFLVNDAVHPEVQAVYEHLEKLETEIKKLGYVPDKRFVSRVAAPGQEDVDLSIHSEKLAIACALMKLPRGATVRIFKNLRICCDCHNAFKFISKFVGRDIIVRDGKRFHHFRGGNCSCGDYW